MTATATIDRRAYFDARRAGLSPRTAAYAARPAVLDVDWLSHYQVDGEWAEVTIDGRRFRVESHDPQVAEGDCVSCRELVDAYQARDEDVAWMTPEEFDATDHRYLVVTVLDEDGEETPYSASLFGTCGPRNTRTEVRMDDRYVAETILDLAAEALAAEEDATAARRAREAARVAELRGHYLAALHACDVA